MDIWQTATGGIVSIWVQAKTKLPLHIGLIKIPIVCEIEGIVWDKYEGMWDMAQKYDGVTVGI